MADLQNVDGFDWDKGNITKNWVRHQVETRECEEVFFNLPLVVAEDIGHSQDEQRFHALGQTNAGRRLFLMFTIRKNKVRVISARDMTRKEREAHAKANT